MFFMVEGFDISNVTIIAAKTNYFEPIAGSVE